MCELLIRLKPLGPVKNWLESKDPARHHRVFQKGGEEIVYGLYVTLNITLTRFLVYSIPVKLT
jgi:hypothetical protein